MLLLVVSSASLVIRRLPFQLEMDLKKRKIAQALDDLTRQVGPALHLQTLGECGGVHSFGVNFLQGFRVLELGLRGVSEFEIRRGD